MRSRNKWLQVLSVGPLIGIAVLAVAGFLFPPSAEAATCGRTITADVVAIDQPYFLNRLGAFNADGMMYVLKTDTVTKDTLEPCVRPDGTTNAECERIVSLPDLTGATVQLSRNAQVRPDKRPRPIALRMNVGDCLALTFTNWVAPAVPAILVPTNPINPFAASPAIPPPAFPGIIQRDDQFVSREVGIHVNGMQLVNSISDDGSYVGRNPNSLVCPVGGSCPSGAIPGTTTYTLYAEFENTYGLRDWANTIGGDGGGGTPTLGLHGGINVQPAGAEWYRGNATHHEMTLAKIGTLPGGQPKINYDAVYPCDAVHIAEGKCGVPMFKMMCDAVTAASLVDGSAAKCGPLDINEIAHTDMDAVITGPNRGNFAAGTHYPSTSMNPVQQRPYREYSSFWNDEQTAIQAFPQFFLDPVLRHTLAGSLDAFMINYGANGIGSEIIANRLGLGVMWDCVDCKAEEFFLTSWAVGDPGQLVDVPANFNNPLLGQPGGPIATTALFPADPSTVHHGYLNEHVKLRNIHNGPFEHHIFHLHAHQWVFAPQSDTANYQDMQQVGPGSGYTFDIVNGGAGNRHKTPGDAIYHCHFYPHFAMGMWNLFRNHEVFEEGTVVEGEVARATWSLRAGLPVVGARALVDGEVKIDPVTGACIGVCRGTPIPFVLPLPTYALAPMPGGVSVDPAEPRRWKYDAADLAAGKTPGFPFYIAGMAGHRAASPPLDIEFDGGLPRHIITTSQVPGVTAEWVTTRLDMNKELLKIGAEQLPEDGTKVEKVTMNFHAKPFPGHPSFTQEGTPMAFEVNGLPARPGAPYADPCRDSLGRSVKTGNNPTWYDKDLNPVFNLDVPVQFGDGNERHYRVANIQIDSVFNKAGWHHAQNRIITLWDDIMPTYQGKRPPEPMVFRMNTLDCAVIHQVNLTPNFYELDDFQVRFPTDIIAQHVHLPKFDVTAADGAANGWNYEDGSLSPGEVHERIHALNAGFGFTRLDGSIDKALEPQAPPQLAGKTPFPVTGARINIQRWFADPVLDNKGVDRGLNNSFTHDHFGPSSFQQLGLYATVLAEPAGSKWLHNETGNRLGTRFDGGPTSWQAVIVPPDQSRSYREFYFEFSDFQHAYERDWDGIIDADSFLSAINPSVKVDIPNDMHSLIQFVGICPSAPGQIVPRPCPEVIALSDPGILIYNYRNEPVGLRVYDPKATNPFDGGLGAQTKGLLGDLSFALSSLPRKVDDLNDQMQSCIRKTIVDPTITRVPGAGIQFNDILGRDAVPVGINHNVGPELPCPQLTKGVFEWDPATPLVRAYNGDRIKFRVQVGATEETHTFSAHGVKWLQNYADPVSGWRNAQSMGISEQFQFDFPLFVDFKDSFTNTADFYYASDTSQQGVWTGTWGLMRAYNKRQDTLKELPNNPVGRAALDVDNDYEFDGFCPKNAPKKIFSIAAVAGKEVLPVDPVLGIKTLIYNSRQTVIPDIFVAEAGGPEGNPPILLQGGQGPLHDPTALMYVHLSDVVLDPATRRPVGLKPGTPIEPLVLRANSGDCIEVTLRNMLPVPNFPGTGIPNASAPQFDLDGFNEYQLIVDRQEVVGPPAQKITFNANDTAPSSRVGLHPQLVAYNILDSDGANVGQNFIPQTADPGRVQRYQWYAGDVRLKNKGIGEKRSGYDAMGYNDCTKFELVATPVEFGATGLIPSDKLEQVSKGLVGALVIEPKNATCVEDPTTRAQATCSAPLVGTWRDFVAVSQTSVNQMYANVIPNEPTKQFRPVQNVHAEGVGAAPDAEDTGQKAFNYKTEPVWFRLGAFPPHTPFEVMAKFPQAAAFSNAQVGGTDPETPIFLASAGSPVRMHIVDPAGNQRNTAFKVHGHLWEREPYIMPKDFDGDGRLDGPTAVGNNPVSQKIGMQIGFGASNFFDLLFPSAGGAFRVNGDYYYGAQDPISLIPGLWGIMRVQ